MSTTLNGISNSELELLFYNFSRIFMTQTAVSYVLYGIHITLSITAFYVLW